MGIKERLFETDIGNYLRKFLEFGFRSYDLEFICCPKEISIGHNMELKAIIKMRHT